MSLLFATQPYEQFETMQIILQAIEEIIGTWYNQATDFSFIRGRSIAMESSPTSGNPLVILNPTANRGNMEQHRALLRSRLEQEPQAEYVETTRRGEAEERAMHAAKEGRPIMVVGGDGSVHEVVNGILSADRRVPLGIVAAGSGNDYAWHTLKLPRD